MSSPTPNSPDPTPIHGGFRPDIEGLRGVAVLLVLLYHCTFYAFQGGYIGVDVFFVISGYLITRLLIREFETNTFSVRNFYVRRIRRLIPALLATIIATLIAGLFILSPEHLKELGTSSIFAALSLSNVHFAFSDGYFETSSKIKPLLHTWSLSVEEQFYLVWPFVLWGIFSLAVLRRHLFLLVGLALLAGFVLSEYWIGRNPAHAYFLSPFRAYQLLAGAMAVWAERRLAGSSSQVANALVLLGLAIVLATALFFDEATPFPGIYGAIPALGGFLIIAAGAHAPAITRVLSVPGLPWLGRISYSAYLAHWPIIVYARYLSPDPFTMTDKILLLAASIGVGWLLHVTVEAPFRISGAGKGAGHRWGEAKGVALVSAGCIAAAGLFHVSGGLPSRMSLASENHDFARTMEFEFLRDYGDGIRSEGAGTSGARVLIFGDSMMQNYIPALLDLPEIAEAEVTLITRGGCPMGWHSLQVVNGGVDRDCRGLRDAVYEDAQTYDLVIWSQSWMEYDGRLHTQSPGGPVLATGEGFDRWREIVTDTVEQMAPRAGRMVLFGPQITVDEVPPILTRIGPVTPLDRIPAEFDRMTETRAEDRDSFAADLKTALPDLTIVDPEDLLCTGDTCPLHDGTVSYYFDPIHHTAAATPLLSQGIARVLAPVLGW